MANYLRILAIALLATALLSSLLCSVAGECNAAFHSAAMASKCSPGASPSDDCCGAVFVTLAAGGAACLCQASHLATSVSAGFTTADYENFYEGCGGTGDYHAEVTYCNSTRGASTLPVAPSPPPPASAPPPPPPPPLSTPPPPSLQVEVVEKEQWWHVLLDFIFSFVALVALVALLFFVVNFCKGRPADIAATALERILCITPANGRHAQPGTTVGIELPPRRTITRANSI